MFFKRLGLLVLLWGLLVIPASAAMVSFMVIETGIRPEADTGEYSYAWEDGLMGTFFDAGHIVTNSTVLRMQNAPAAGLPPEAQADFREAAEGWADFFVLVILEYNSSDGRLRPRSAIIRVFSTATGRMTYEQAFPAGSGSSVRDEHNAARQAASAVAAQLEVR